MFSTYLHPASSSSAAYTAVSTNSLAKVTPIVDVAIMLPNKKANWVTNVKTAIKSSKTDTAVYWSKPGCLTGIRSSEKLVASPGTLIAVMESGTSKIVYGQIKDIILPETTVDDLCSYYSNEELGVAVEDNAQNVISQALGIPKTAGVVGYEIEIGYSGILQIIVDGFILDNKPIPQHGCYIW